MDGSWTGTMCLTEAHAVPTREDVMGERNNVRCGSIEHKMGIHGSPTCVSNLDGAQAT